MAGLTKEDLTAGSGLNVSEDGKHIVSGTGMFDDLMEAVTVHVTAQYDLGRLSGPDYASVYAGSIQSAMSSAVSYLTGKPDPDLLAAQINKINAEILLVEAQKAKADAELLLIQGQQAKVDAETELLKQKKVTEQAQTQNIADPESFVGSQISVYREQAKGFYWNAKKGWAKLTVDAASVDASQGEGTTQAADNSSSDRTAAEPLPNGGTVG